MPGPRTTRFDILLLGLAACLCFGCYGSRRGLHYLGDKGLNYYKEQAQTIDYPHVHEPVTEEVQNSGSPRTILDRKHDKVRDISLSEAMHLALANNRVIQTGPAGTIGGSAVLNNPNFADSIYDPAIQETGVLFGSRGMESALAAFDTQFTTSMRWGRDETIPNIGFFGPGSIPGATVQSDSGAFSSRLQKAFGYGGQFTLFHNWDYSFSNAQARLFPSAYTGNIGARYRQPLLAGAGTEFTRIAGPITQSFGGLSGVTQGVVIARINNDISLADFQIAVRNSLRDVETAYWDLYLAYQQYHTTVVERNSALRTWEEARKIAEQGGGREGFQLWEVQQALEQYYATRARADAALNRIYAVEANLRRLLGLSINDGTILRPLDTPSDARVLTDWEISLAEALTRRIELRRQKWNIKSLQLQLQAANSLTKPRLDFVAGYQVNGFGDKLLSRGDGDGLTAQGFNSAYESLTQGDQTGWTLGLEMDMPFGLRSAHAQVRNVELRLAKARDTLGLQERDISHELALAYRNIALHYENARAHLSRRQAAQERLRQFAIRQQLGDRGFTLDDVLRAQASVAQAEIDYYTSLIEYNKAIMDLHFAKGTLLDHNNVFLAEGGWTRQAYQDALRRALARSHAIDNELVHAEPQEFVMPEHSETIIMPAQTDPEPPPAPDAMEPEPADGDAPSLPDSP